MGAYILDLQESGCSKRILILHEYFVKEELREIAIPLFFVLTL